MAVYLGIDTSNYTTSCALYDSETNLVRMEKKLLPVREGELGLRQSDAVFHHTVQLPDLLEQLFAGESVAGVCVSGKPTAEPGSYMPCFLAGLSAARAVAAAMQVPLIKTTHQTGHILAALYSAGKLDLIHAPFYCFHVSGGTTQLLLVQPHPELVLKVETVAQSLDLKAGQVVDRTGVMLGLPFPAGPTLDALAQTSEKQYQIRPSMKQADCCLSGIENKVRQKHDAGEAPEDIAKYSLSCLSAALLAMADRTMERHGRLPLVCAGGVMCNTQIRAAFETAFGAHFAEPAYSSDNAAGVAIYGTFRLEGTADA